MGISIIIIRQQIIVIAIQVKSPWSVISGALWLHNYIAGIIWVVMIIPIAAG